MTKNKCAHKYCKLKVFEDDDYCIFHCDKESWILGDNDTSGSTIYHFNKKWDEKKSKCFWEQLDRYIKYIIKLEDRSFKRHPYNNTLQKSPFNYIDGIRCSRTRSQDKDYHKKIYFFDIKFPPTSYDIKSKIFEIESKYLKTFYFNSCYFYDNFIDLCCPDAQDVKIDLHFDSSEFEGNISFERRKKYNNISLRDCKVKGHIGFLGHFDEITIENTKISSIIINSNNLKYQARVNKFHIKRVILNDNTTNEIFVCNKVTIDELEIINRRVIEQSKKIKTIVINRANIQNKISLQNLNINNLTIKNSDFLENSKIILQNLIINCFRLIKIFQDSKIIIFENITVYKNFRCNKINFKNTHFNNFNVQKAKKFLRNTSFVDSNINTLHWGNIEEIKAPKSIFRLLKNVYDKQANFLEANKFYAMEMQEHKKELSKTSWKENFQEKFIFWTNEKMSNFGQSIFRPIVGIILLTLLYTLIIYGNEHEWLMQMCPKCSKHLNTLMHWLNSPLKNIKPLEKILKEH